MKKMERTKPPRNNSLRRELESYVTAYNKYLREIVTSMDLVILLRNAHPALRGSFAGNLYDDGWLTKDEANEFVTRK